MIFMTPYPIKRTDEYKYRPYDYLSITAISCVDSISVYFPDVTQVIMCSETERKDFFNECRLQTGNPICK